MRVLIGCEYSGIIREQFKKLGHEAWSCDLLPTELEGKHYQGNVLDILDKNWDLAIFHPTCTYLSSSGAKWFYHPDDNKLDIRKRRPHPKYPNRRFQQKKAIEFFMKLIEAPIPRICVENPIGIMSTVYRKPDQIVCPSMFGHVEAKKTCLWLKNIPKLVATNVVEPEYVIHGGKRIPKWYSNASGDRRKTRSKSFEGMAKAMAEQYSI